MPFDFFSGADEQRDDIDAVIVARNRLTEELVNLFKAFHQLNHCDETNHPSEDKNVRGMPFEMVEVSIVPGEPVVGVTDDLIAELQSLEKLATNWYAAARITAIQSHLLRYIMASKPKLQSLLKEELTMGQIKEAVRQAKQQTTELKTQSVTKALQVITSAFGSRFGPIEVQEILHISTEDSSLSTSSTGKPSVSNPSNDSADWEDDSSGEIKWSDLDINKLICHEVTPDSDDNDSWPPLTQNRNVWESPKEQRQPKKKQSLIQQSTPEGKESPEITKSPEGPNFPESPIPKTRKTLEKTTSPGKMSERQEQKFTEPMAEQEPEPRNIPMDEDKVLGETESLISSTKIIRPQIVWAKGHSNPLSNMYMAPLRFGEYLVPSAEHLYQIRKFEFLIV